MSTKIEWVKNSDGTDGETWNPVTGCTPVSAGCTNCYAHRMARRLAGRFGYPADEPFRVTLHPDKLKEPMCWKKPRHIFVCSMGDLFHEELGWSDIEQIFMVMVKARHHTFQVLTKRADRMQEFVSTCFPDLAECSPHIWLGVTAENQAAADERIPILLQVPAVVRFVSCEPLLGPIDILQYMNCDYSFHHGAPLPCPNVNWIIAGGEAGPRARPAHPDWFRVIRDQCINAGVPFFFKQWGEWLPNAQEYGCHQSGVSYNCRHVLIDGTSLPDVMMAKVGKKAAGHLLDGKEWRQWPDCGYEAADTIHLCTKKNS